MAAVEHIVEGPHCVFVLVKGAAADAHRLGRSVHRLCLPCLQQTLGLGHFPENLGHGLGLHNKIPRRAAHTIPPVYTEALSALRGHLFYVCSILAHKPPSRNQKTAVEFMELSPGKAEINSSFSPFCGKTAPQTCNLRRWGPIFLAHHALPWAERA